jgi:hypothetical protein
MEENISRCPGLKISPGGGFVYRTFRYLQKITGIVKNMMD